MMADWKPRVTRLPNDERNRLLVANALIQEGQNDKAELELKNLLIQDENFAPANLAMGRLCLRQRKYGESIPYLERAIAGDPMQPQAPLLAGISYYLTKDTDRAGEYFQSALNLDNRLSGAHFGLALVANRNKDAAVAVDHLQEALRLDPQLTVAHLMLAAMQRKAGDPTAAAETLRNVIDTQPDQRTAVVSLAMIYMQHDEQDEAIGLMDAYVERNPDDTMPMSMLGRMRMRANDYAGAEDAFKKASKGEDSMFVGRRMQLVSALIHQSKFDEAQQLLDSAPRRAGQRPLVDKAYGDLYFAQNQFRKAADTFRAVVLRGKRGEDLIAEIDKTSPAKDAADTEWRKNAEAYQAVVNDVSKSAMKRLTEEDWQSLFQRSQPALLKIWEGRQQSAAAS